MHWLAPDSRSRALHERARSQLAELRPDSTMSPASTAPWIAEARGAWLRDLDGRRCLDLAANSGTLLHGHAHPLINAAVADQLERGCCTSLPCEPELALAELLCGRVPSFERIHLCAGEDDALRALRGVLRDATGQEGMLRVDDDPALGAHGSCAAIDSADSSLAAVVVDPAPARHGFTPRSAADLAAIEQCARDRGALVVLDERRAFRLGFAGAQGRIGASPDLTLLGALIGGGWTAAAIAGLEPLMASADTQSSGAPPSARPDPLAMVAGHTALSMLDLAAFEQLDALGETFRTRMAGTLEAGPLPVTVAGTGSSFALRSADHAIIAALLRVLLTEGVLLDADGSGHLGTTCGAAEIEHCAAALERALDVVATEHAAS